MILQLFFLQTSYVILSKSVVDAYVLLAANVDDFRTIAKQIIPGKLADQLADMASIANNQKHSGKEEDYDIRDVGIDELASDSRSDTLSQKKRFIIRNKLKEQAKDLDLDELVKRVKNKLQREFKVTQSTKKVINIDDYYYKDDNLNVKFTNEDVEQTDITPLTMLKFSSDKPVEEGFQYDHVKEEYHDENVPYSNENKYYPSKAKETYTPQDVKFIQDEKIQPSIEYIKEPQIGNGNENTNVQNENAYYDEMPKKSETEAVIDSFKEVTIGNNGNDSYEEYVFPEKDDIFASDEATVPTPKAYSQAHKIVAADKFSYKVSRPKAVPDTDIKFIESSSVSKRVVTKPVDIKAKTESLWYKDPKIENYDDSTKSTTARVSDGTTKKKRINTMFPTRAHFKMSSPNYYAKLPAVAEKYNFNEPLPEKDREPEKIKYIGNPPASINKKVKI